MSMFHALSNILRRLPFTLPLKPVSTEVTSNRTQLPILTLNFSPITPIHFTRFVSPCIYYMQF